MVVVTASPESAARSRKARAVDVRERGDSRASRTPTTVQVGRADGCLVSFLRQPVQQTTAEAGGCRVLPEWIWVLVVVAALFVVLIAVLRLARRR